MVDVECDCFVQLRQILVLAEIAHFQLECAEESFHKAVLPGAGSFTATEGYFQFVAQELVFVAEVFCALVTVQDCWNWMFAEGVKQR